jgi:preprotein translocase subunit SecA
MVRYAALDPRYRDDPDTIQRLVEGAHLDTRVFLHGYELPIEGQRNKVHARRETLLKDGMPEREKRITLRAMDDLWADHLSRVQEYRSGIQWVSWTGRDPHYEYLLKVDRWFREFEESLPVEVARRIELPDEDVPDRGTMWTYLTTDEPFKRWKRQISRELPYAYLAAFGA